MNIFFLGIFPVADMKKKKKKIFGGANWMGYCPSYIVRRENSNELNYCIFRSSREGYWRF